VPAEQPEQPELQEGLTLSNLKPAQKRRARKRVGRGLGSGKGRYSGRGIKGQKARSGSHTMRPGFEGGQTPIYMRLPKKRGPYSKDAMPFGPHRTQTVPVNLRDLDRVFDDGAEVSLEAMVEKGLIKNTRTDVTAHAFSASAREKIEQAGGSASALRPPHEEKRRRRKAAAAPEAAAEPEAEAQPEEPQAEQPAADEPAEEASE
jgi:large subunit ribosomal protein L15